MDNFHVIDPSYFDDAIAEFATYYDWYPQTGKTTDDLGRRHTSFDHQQIYCSLQPSESSLNQKNTGNITSKTYNLYCKSIYRVEIGDFVKFGNDWLHVDGVQNYDLWGVRQAKLTMVNLNSYVDFRDYIRYLDGELIV